MNTRTFVLAILSPLGISVVAIAHWWMNAHSTADTDTNTDTDAAVDGQRIVNAFDGSEHTDGDSDEESQESIADAMKELVSPPKPLSPWDDIDTDTDTCPSPSAAVPSAPDLVAMFDAVSCQEINLSEQRTPELALVVGSDDDECEPELACDLVLTKTVDASDPRATVQTSAVALAHRFVPSTTTTGCFECEPTLPDTVTSSLQWCRYQTIKNQFKVAAIKYVVNAAVFRVELDADDNNQDNHGRVKALTDAYMRLTRCPSFEVEQRAMELEREQVSAQVNAAALCLVRLASTLPKHEMSTTSVVSSPSLPPLEKRLDDANALSLFRRTPEQLAGASLSVFTSVDTAMLSLLELRALHHAFDSYKSHMNTAEKDPDAHEWLRRLKTTISVAKRHFDEHRRRQMQDDGQCCCPPNDADEHPTCAFRLVYEHVLPLYAAHAKAIVIIRYCDAEVAAH